TLSLQDKVKLKREVNRGVQKKKDMAQEFDILANTLLTVFKNLDAILRVIEESQCKRMKEAKHTDLEEALVKWMKFVRDQNILLLKAEHFAKELGHSEFQASVGWLDKLKSRHNTLFKNVCGKSAAVSDNDCDTWRIRVLPNLFKDYRENDFNADETGLFFKCLPDKTMTFKGDNCHSGRHSKECVPAMVAANMLGTEKLPLLVTGKSKKPHCFRNENNKKSWMTSEIYHSWLLKLDRKFNSAKRKVLLFVDNCPAHPKALSTTLKAIKVVFLPPNMMSKLQPMDQGIIKKLKEDYRKRIILGILLSLEEGQSITISLLDCIGNIDKAWKDVKPMIIAHCFRKVGFTKENIDLHFMVEEDKEMEESDWISLQGKLGFTKEVTFEAYVDMDSDVVVASYLMEEDILLNVVITKQGSVDCGQDDKGADNGQESDNQSEPFILPPSCHEVSTVANTLQSFVESRSSVPDSVFNAFTCIEGFIDGETKR
uniref:HTH CENPB-type domain-containing protein n=1 Tax=Latimeria chalumnae TaxID=7897 RepID=H3A6S1_LATCH